MGSIGGESIRVEPAGELDLLVRMSFRLRPGVLGLLFVHGGQVIADAAPVEQASSA
jgi:hypothetical protein